MLWLRIKRALGIISNDEFDELALIRSIRISGLFDENWYLQQYPDAKSIQIDPVEHYFKYGWKDGKSPSKYFDTKDYLNRYPEIAGADMCPLYHYLRWGNKEGRTAKTVSGRYLFYYKRSVWQRMVYAWEYPIRVRDECKKLQEEIRSLRNTK